MSAIDGRRRGQIGFGGVGKPSISCVEQLLPSVPEGIRIYAIGDVHGRLDLLDQVLARIDTDLANDPAQRPIQVFLGDYIDRGPASREVLDRLIARGGSCETVFLKGNHEAFVTEFLDNPGLLAEWQKYGGLETLISYGLTPPLKPSAAAQLELATALRKALPDSHRGFLRQLKSSFTCGDFFFAHAGVKPGVPLTHQDEDDLLWIRDDFLHYEGDFGKVIVHGHTPVREPDVRSNRINIDTGAYATGRLTCLMLEGDRGFVI